MSLRRNVLLLVALGLPPLAAHPPEIYLYGNLAFEVAAGSGASPRVLTVVNATHGPMAWTATVSAAWLSVSPSSGALPGLTFTETSPITVNVNLTGLSPGTYSAMITVSAAGAINTPQSFPVVLSLAAPPPPPTLRVTPSTISLQGVTGGTASSTVNFNVLNAGGPGALTWTAAAEPASAAWLTVFPASGVSEAVATAAASAERLAAGTYTGRIRLTGATSDAVVTVTFAVRAPTPPVIQANQPSLQFMAVAESASPPAQYLGITNGGESKLNWKAGASTFNGGGWLAVTPAAGTGAAFLSIVPTLGSLPGGTYAGRITITADGAANSPVQVPVVLTVRRPSAEIPPGGAVNAASLVAGALAPGVIATVFGTRLGPRSAVFAPPVTAESSLPLDLAGTRVTVDEFRAPLFFASANQVNFQIPYELAGRPSVKIKVEAAGADAAETTVTLRPVAPALFTFEASRAAALHSDFTVNAPDNPAAAGDIVQLFLTGQGLLDPPVTTGRAAPAVPPFPQPVAPLSVQVGGRDARVLFAGMAPGLVGVAQVNVEVPAATPPSDRVSVQVTMPGEPPSNIAYLSTGPPKEPESRGSN